MHPRNAVAVDPSRKRVAVIYNPAAGFLQRGRLRRFLRHLRGLGHEVLLRRTAGPGHATRLAAALDPAAVDVAVAAGGDGTVNEVANGLIGGPIPLAIVPLGTANVMAFELGLGLGMARAARLPSEGRIVEIVPALVGARGFLLMVSAGPDARVVAAVNTRLKRLIGKGAYVVVALKEIAFGSPRRLAVLVDGQRYEAGLAVITHARHYGGPFVIAPQARLGDASVTVLLLPGSRRRDLLRYGLALVTNRLSRLSDARLLTARHVRIDGPAGEPVQSDGDLIGTAPLEVSVGGRPLRLLVPDPDRVRAPDASSAA